MTPLFSEQVHSGTSGANATGTTWGPAKTGHREQFACTVVFGAGTSAGVVTLETAHDADYTGTWHSLGTITWSAATKVGYLRVDGPLMAVRARISTAIVGGTIDVYLSAT